MVLARMFGADAATDAFFVAFRIPNLLRRLFAEGAFSLAFVPVLSEYRSTRSRGELREFVDKMAGSLGLVLFITMLVGELAAPLLVMVFAPGFIGENGDKYQLAVEMLRITFPYIFLISLTAFAGSILNAHSLFGVPAFTPVWLNLILIACALWLSPHLDTPVMALAWGVFIAGCVQLIFQFPFLRRIDLMPRPRVAFHDRGVMKVIRLMVPALFGVSVSQLNMLLDTLIASFLVSGSITWLFYSDRLMEFPVGVLGVALGTVILPNLSRQHAEKTPEEFSATLDWALRVMILLGFPAAIGLVLTAGPLLTTLFYSEAFGQHDVLMSTRSLIAYSPGLLAILLIKVLAPGFYARQDTRSPVRIGIIAMVLNMVFNLIFVFPLAHAGLALATTLSSFVNAYLLYRGLMTSGVYRPGHAWKHIWLSVIMGSFIMGGMLFWGLGEMDAWFGMGNWARVLTLMGWIIAAALVYFVTLYATGIRLHHFRTRPVRTTG